MADTRPKDPTPGTTSDFPLRVAAVDVGSNAIRFLAAEFSEPATFRQLEVLRAPVRLGHEAFLTGRLAEPGMDAAVAALAGFRRRMEQLDIVRYRAVATSAVRDSANGRELVERVREEAGLRLEAITGAEEARLVHLAIRGRVEMGGREWVLADLGGGSLEVSLADAEGVRWTTSHPLGMVRLLEALGEDEAQSPARFGRALDRNAAMLEVRAAVRGLDAAGLIATGGNIEALAELAGAPPDARGVRTLSLARLGETIDLLAGLTPRRRVEELGLREDRADVVLPAAVLYARVAEAVGVGEVVVPGVGVREGVVVEVAGGGRPPPILR